MYINISGLSMYIPHEMVYDGHNRTKREQNVKYFYIYYIKNEVVCALFRVWLPGGRKESHMTRQRSWKEYRTIDLGLWAGMLAIFEYLILQAANWWFPGQPYTVSLASAITSIVYMRWGVWGMIHAFEAGFVFCLFSGATGEQYVIYCCGNLFSVAAVILLRVVGKERVRTGRLSFLPQTVFPCSLLL